MNPSQVAMPQRTEVSLDATRRAVTTSATPSIDSRTLFGARNVLLIRHDEQDYTLRITRNGKLILTK